MRSSLRAGLRLARTLLRYTDEWVLLGLSVVLFLVATNTQTGWLYLVSAGMLGLLLVGYLGPRRQVRGLEIRVRLPEQAEQEHVFDVALVLRNRGRRVVRDLAFEVPPQNWEHVPPERRWVWLARLEPGEERTLTVPVRARVRGRHQVQGVHVLCRYPLGLFPVRRELAGDSQAVLVYPYGPDLNWFRERARRAQRRRSGSSARAVGQTRNLRRLREYVRGEDIRSVHWPTTARAGTLMVREFEAEAGGGLAVYLDTRLELGNYPDTCLEAAVRLAASALVAAARAGRDWRLCGVCDRWWEVGSPRLEAARRCLALVECRAEPPAWERSQEQLHRLLLQGHELILVLTSAAEAELAALAQRASQVLVVLIAGRAYASGDATADLAVAGRLRERGFTVLTVEPGREPQELQS